MQSELRDLLLAFADSPDENHDQLLNYSAEHVNRAIPLILRDEIMAHDSGDQLHEVAPFDYCLPFYAWFRQRHECGVILYTIPHAESGTFLKFKLLEVNSAQELLEDIARQYFTMHGSLLRGGDE